MKFLFFSLFFVMAVVCWASPVPELESGTAEKLGEFAALSPLVRHKRATCPFLPGACELHCRTKGFSTGFCRGPTCTCKNY